MIRRDNDADNLQLLTSGGERPHAHAYNHNDHLQRDMLNRFGEDSRQNIQWTASMVQLAKESANL